VSLLTVPEYWGEHRGHCVEKKISNSGCQPILRTETVTVYLLNMLLRNNFRVNING